MTPGGVLLCRIALWEGHHQWPCSLLSCTPVGRPAASLVWLLPPLTRSSHVPHGFQCIGVVLVWLQVLWLMSPAGAHPRVR